MLIVPVGADVAFPNLDKVRHHVYSFSAGNKFEIKLYGHEENRTAKMSTVGVAAIGCNIHDQMVGFIRVVDTAYAAKTDANGVVTIQDVPSRRRQGQVWHPYMRAMKNEKALTTTSVSPARRASRSRSTSAPRRDTEAAPMFKRLQTKLTVLYAGLFALALSLVAVTVYVAIASNAQRAVREELAASGTVFDRVWALRTQRLHDGADLLSRDFGFRAAVATHDRPTVESASPTCASAWAWTWPSPSASTVMSSAWIRPALTSRSCGARWTPRTAPKASSLSTASPIS
jgi:hypothetical protein